MKRKWGLEEVHIRTWVSQTKDRKQSRDKKLSANKPSKESLSKKKKLHGQSTNAFKCSIFLFLSREESTIHPQLFFISKIYQWVWVHEIEKAHTILNMYILYSSNSYIHTKFSPKQS